MDALIGTIIGGLLAILGGLAVKAFEEWRSRQSLRAAFRAEIGSIVGMMGLRGHERMFEEVLDHWKAGRQGTPRVIGLLTAPIDPVYSRNTHKVGLLGRQAKPDIVIAARLAGRNTSIIDYYCFPRRAIGRRYFLLGGHNDSWADAYRHETLDGAATAALEGLGIEPTERPTSIIALGQVN